MSHPTDTRRPIEAQKQLKLYKLGSKESVTFTIKEYIGHGGSTLCYEAEMVDCAITKSGRLKEIYPADQNGAYFHFKRDPKSNCLVADNEQQRAALQSVIDNTVSAYKKLGNVRSSFEQGSVLNNFVPDAYLFTGSPSGSSTLYIWTPSDKYGITFEEYLQQMDSSDPEQAAVNLKNIIVAICTLTACICSFHDNGLLHLDIKPGNFLICKNNVNYVNPNIISMFDINTVFDMNGDGVYYRDLGTPGFALTTRSALTSPTPVCDIYSIVATLFYALSADADDRHYTYKSLSGFSMSAGEVKAFPILAAAKHRYDNEFTDTLMSVFRKGFSHAIRGSDRYVQCEELLEDLRYLNRHLRVDSSAESSSPDEEIAVTKKRGMSDPYSKVVIQNLLYTTPLYRYSESDECNVLVLGSGAYSCSFVDGCLQAGQMIFRKEDGEYDYKKLNVTVVSQCACEDMKNFIRHRPALTSFFNVNGALDGSTDEIYGTLSYKNCADVVPGKSRFVVPSHSHRSTTNNTTLVDAILSRHTNLQYVFVALGSYALNLEVARCVSERLNRGDSPVAVVAFAWDKTTAPDGLSAGMHAVYMPRRASKQLPGLDADLERMAFNAHLIWNQSVKDFARIEQEYRDPYNHASSLAFALSIKYKLHCIGIDIEKYEDHTAVADAYHAMVLESAGSTLFDLLAALEHRRWVVEKLTDKWVPPAVVDGVPDLSFCLKGNTKDRDNHIHPCITRSRADSSLTAAGLTHAQWDDEKFDISDLDELDQVSVRIHRTYLGELRKREASGSHFRLDNLSQVSGIIATLDQTIVDSYNELIFCIQNILDDNARYAYIYTDMMKGFISQIEDASGVSSADKSIIVATLKLAHEMLYIKSSSLKYEDFKSKDAAIIRYMPYILTYSSKLHLAVPLFIGSESGSDVTNNAIFRNVAAATLIIPRKISYIYYCDDRRALERIRKVIGYIKNYFTARRLICTLSFLIAHDASVSNAELEEKLSELRSDSDDVGGVLVDISYIPSSGKREALTKLCDCIQGVSDGDRADLFEENDSPLSMSAAMTLDIPSYQFDSVKGTFCSCSDCSFVKYITLSSKHALMVDDMLLLKNAGSKKSDVPAYQRHYKNLWSLYSSYSSAWKSLCDALEKHFLDRDRVVFFKIPNKPNHESDSFIIPVAQRAVADKLIRELSEPHCGVLGEKSSIFYYDQSTVEVRVTACRSHINLFREALAKLSGITSPDLVCVKQTAYNEFSIMLDRLDVSGLEIKGLYPNAANALSQLLEQLNQFKNPDNGEEFRYIEELLDINYQKIKIATITPTDGTHSVTLNFRFNSYAIKRLLCSAGRLLEVYVYYKLKESGYFDDIVSSSEINWEQSGVTNELDCIATKGLNTIVIECKARTELEQEMFNKLYTIVTKFGINVITVLIADTLRSPKASDNNATQSERAELLDVVLISDHSEIADIGTTLKRIIEEHING